MDELNAFVAVAETGSFVEASKRIGRDASIVSRRVGHLEERLGARLLSRTTRHVALTEVGKAFYDRVRTALDELDSAGADASNLAANPRGLLRVALPITFGRQFVSPLLPGFLKKHPLIQLEARFADRYVDVVAEGYDVAIRVGAVRDSSLTALKIASFKNILVAAPDYLAAHGVPSSPSELSQHACLGFSSHISWPDWVLQRGAERASIRPSGPLVADNSEAVLRAAEDGIGIMLCPDWLAVSAIRDGRLVEILAGWVGSEEGGVYAIMPPGRLIPAKTRVFVDEISQAIKARWPTQMS